MNCPECQRLANECKRREELRKTAQATLDAVALNNSIPEYLSAYEAANDAYINLGLVKGELDAHILFLHNSVRKN